MNMRKGCLDVSWREEQFPQHKHLIAEPCFKYFRALLARQFEKLLTIMKPLDNSGVKGGRRKEGCKFKRGRNAAKLSVLTFAEINGACLLAGFLHLSAPKCQMFWQKPVNPFPSASHLKVCSKYVKSVLLMTKWKPPAHLYYK